MVDEDEAIGEPDRAPREIPRDNQWMDLSEVGAVALDPASEVVDVPQESGGAFDRAEFAVSVAGTELT